MIEQINLFHEVEKSLNLIEVENANKLLEEVSKNISQIDDVKELWRIHDMAVRIEGHGREMKLVAAWNLGRLENERR